MRANGTRQTLQSFEDGATYGTMDNAQAEASMYREVSQYTMPIKRSRMKMVTNSKWLHLRRK